MGKPDEIGVVTLLLARKGLQAARRFAREIIGWPSSIAVVDAGGAVIAVHRMDGAAQATFDIAIEKAWTAAAFRAPTLILGRMTDPRTAMASFEDLPLGQHGMGLAGRHKGRLSTIMGGIPIRDRDMNIIGGIGTSGTPSARDDNTISQAAWSAMYDEEAGTETGDSGPAPGEQMHFSLALRIADRAVREAEKRKLKASVTVTDSNGWPFVIHRTDGAPPATAELSRDKAWTAAAFQCPSPEINRFGRKSLPAGGINTSNWNDRVTSIAGGLPLRRGRILIGAIGVSSNSPELDVKVARAANGGMRWK
jgi:uncharacterized protein GlcG (DUF336 family)